MTITRQRPIIKTRSLRNAERSRERRRVLRALSPGLWLGSHVSAASFRDKLLELGKDPAAYGDLAVPLRGGWRPSGTPAALARSQRYHDLRKRGYCAADASDGAKTENTYAYALRRIALGLRYTPIKGHQPL